MANISFVTLKRLALALLAVSGAAWCAQVAQVTAPLTIDGDLAEPFWETVPARRLNPAEAGVPPDLGGEIRFALRGAEIVLAAHCPEPGGKVLARSIGRNPIWERDSLTSAEVEDRVEYVLRYRAAGGRERSLRVAVNPWGAYRVEQDGEEAAATTIETAATVSQRGWSLEALLPLKMLDLDRKDGARGLILRAERIRSRRALAPEFRWRWEGELALAPITTAPPAVFRPPLLGNREPPLEVGKVLRVPPLTPEWNDEAWRGVPAFSLPRHEPLPLAPRYPTEIKWMHDGRTLAVLVHVVEPEPLMARTGGRDSLFTQDDHVAVYLATSGSAFLEFDINSVGAVRDSRGGARNPLVLARLEPSWNANVEVQTSIRHGGWTARINLPLAECAAALGEVAVPRQWRVLVARYRAARPGEPAEISALPETGSATFYGPVRYRRLILSDLDPSRMEALKISHPDRPRDGLARELAALESRVWSPLDSRYHAVQSMVQRQQRRRAEKAILTERNAWEKVNTREDWERFRGLRLEALRKSLGPFPAERPPLDVRVSSIYEGDGYRRENLVFRSRPGFYEAANLYLPAKSSSHMPGIVILHSNHFPKIQGELQDMGMIWGRAGCAVLVLERLGFGERAETNTWFRQAYASRFTFSKQLGLIGESHSGWVVWDLMRAVDMLYARPDVDRERIIMLGSVAGGAEPAAIAAALDPRIAAVVPYNYDQGHMRVHGDARNQIGGQFSPWLVAASVAPRRFVRPFEFGWEGAEEPDFPELWVDGWLRSQKVWGFYNAPDNLASAQGYGLIRLSMERVSHCWSIGPNQRRELYPILHHWFDIPLPSSAELNMLPDSDLATNPNKEPARLDEARRRRPEEDLRSITPALSVELRRKPLHELALATGVEQLRAARARRAKMTAAEKREHLRRELAGSLGDIEPSRSPRVEALGRRTLSGAVVERLYLEVLDGILIPTLLIRPPGDSRTPVIVGVAQAGKERFLADRATTIAALVRAGFAVCLPDLRGTGETSPDPDRSDDGGHRAMAEREFALGANLMGARLKDLRTVLAYLGSRADVDRSRIGLWGESFAPANPSDLFLDELQWEAGPQIQRYAEPLGAHLVTLAALYEDGVGAVVAHGGLTGYVSVLEDAFTYTPLDIMIPEVLKAGDMADFAAAIVPRAFLMAGAVSGRNVRLTEAELQAALAPLREAYRGSSQLTLRTEPQESDVTSWLTGHLR
jgi:cephalosporin-C deacetylase-like acetyl esterase